MKKVIRLTESDIESLVNKIIKEDDENPFSWTDNAPSHEKHKIQKPSQYDLSDDKNLDGFYDEIVSIWNKYTGHRPNNAAMANDNRVLLFNLLMSGDFAKKINQRISPSGLHQGSHGREYWTNNPDQMKAFLTKMGVTDAQLKPMG